MPEKAVGATIDKSGKLDKWVLVGSEEYKRTARTWAGLPEDGSKGDPLFVAGAISDDFSDISEDDNVPDREEGELEVS